ncbi:hypothetical protein FIBSPDRAFT_874130 [Athelia psychrophila]|uniref:Uncharacterized protein n=1 Tax=Athelia psychrophila TaxID=1759441 RepID=A0A165XT58_9AGAM|nr:hypothetical protein FIBSPDRAFT_874130 [Fibularhizoctonia sp. CBS 109695]
MATICNTGADFGATTSIFQFNRPVVDYLDAMKRLDIANGQGRGVRPGHRPLGARAPHQRALHPGSRQVPLQVRHGGEREQPPEELKIVLIDSGSNSSY